MPIVDPLRQGFISRATSRLKFPQAFALLLGLFLVDLVVPDLIPFVDELLLGLLTVVFGTLRERVLPPGPGGAEKPPIKDITPR